MIGILRNEGYRGEAPRECLRRQLQTSHRRIGTSQRARRDRRKSGRARYTAVDLGWVFEWDCLA
jgi:hypothetical protein